MANKWIEIASNRQPAALVARQVLTARVQYVQKRLPLAAYEYADDIEHVHQLRVACRRAGAALQAFRPLMSQKPASLRRWLRRIRQAAGPARDTDVLLERLQKSPPASYISEYVLARLQQQRINVQQQLVKVEKRAQPKKIDRSLKQCLELLGSDKQKRTSIKKFAKVALHKACQPVLELTALQKPTFDQLHELRIAGKRLRYSIELFHDVFSADLRTELYPLVEKLQSQLGKINDHATAQALFQYWLAQLPVGTHAAELAGYIVAEHESAERLKNDFLKWWTADRIALLKHYLSEL